MFICANLRQHLRHLREIFPADLADRKPQIPADIDFMTLFLEFLATVGVITNGIRTIMERLHSGVVGENTNDGVNFPMMC